MNSYIQETDSKMIFPLPPEINRPFSVIDYKDETFGGCSGSQFLPLPIEYDLIRQAWKALRQIKNEGIANEARRVLTIIEETITTFQHLRFDLGHLPYLRAFDVEDGSTLIEWIFDDFRIGFSIETTLDESSWYLMSNPNLGEISASGYILGSDLENLILWLFNFILSHT